MDHTYISGATKIYIINHGKTKFLLLGDRHIMAETALENSISVIELIERIRQETINTERYLDVYIEVSITDVPIMSDDELVKHMLNQVREKYKVELYDTQSDLSNVHFYPTDTRQVITRNIFHLDLPDYINHVHKNIITQREMAIFTDPEANENTHMTMIKYDIIAEIFIRDPLFIKSGVYDYIKLCLESDNFVTDFNRLFSDSFEKFKYTHKREWMVYYYALYKKYISDYKECEDYVDSAIDRAIDYFKMICLSSQFLKIYHGKPVHIIRALLLDIKERISKDLYLNILNYGYEYLANITFEGYFEIYNMKKKLRRMVLSKMEIFPERIGEIQTDENLTYFHNFRFLSIGMFLMDIYTICLMYNNIYDRHETSTVIVYEGLYHIDNIVNFMRKINNVKVHEFDHEKNHIKCVPVLNSLLFE